MNLLYYFCLFGYFIHEIRFNTAKNADLEKLTKNVDLLAIKTLQRLSEKNAEDNIFMSLFDVIVGSGLLTVASKGETTKELARTFDFPSSKTELNALFLALSTKLALNPREIVLKTYVSSDFACNDEFRAIAKEIYYTEVINVDFRAKQETVLKINRDVAENSNDILQNTLAEIPATEVSLIYMAGFYVQGEWSLPFDPAQTTLKKFTVSPVLEKQVETMSLSSGFVDYYANSGGRFVELPFGKASMIIALSNDSMPNNSELNFRKQCVKVTIPKFQLDSRIDLGSYVGTELGLAILSESKVDLSGIGGKQGDIKVDAVSQHTYLRLNEAGITVPPKLNNGGVLDECENPIEFTVDRPFTIKIISGGFTLAAARIIDPAATLQDAKRLS